MIVQCEHCQTKYRIADEKVKGKGVKVRCAKCENVFTVTPPIQDQDTAPPQPPSEAASPSLEEAPAASRDASPGLPPLSPEDKPAPGPEDESAGLPPLPPLGDTVEPPAPDWHQEAGDTAFPDRATTGKVPPSFDIESRDFGAQRPAHETDQSGLVSPPAEAGSMPEDGGFEIEATLREDPGPGSDLLGRGANEGLPPLTRETDLGGDWGNIPIEGQDSADSGSSDFGLAGESGYVPPPPAAMEEPEEGPLSDSRHEPALETSTMPAYEPETRSSGGAKKGVIILLILAALGAGGYFAYPMVKEMILSRTQQAEGTLTPANIKVKQLSRADGKVLYAVRGVVMNESAGNVGMIQVEAQFRDASGGVLSKAKSYCGNLFEDSALVKLDISQVRSDLKNELGQSLSNASIAPGQAVPFLIVLDNPPPGISKVTVTISSFKETT